MVGNYTYDFYLQITNVVIEYPTIFKTVQRNITNYH